MASDLVIVLSSAGGDVDKGEKRVNFGVILVNRRSDAIEWTDRNEFNCIGKRNVPATTY